MMAPPPTPHRPMSTTDGTAHAGSCSERGGCPIPIALSIWFTGPTSGLSSDTQRIATAENRGDEQEGSEDVQPPHLEVEHEREKEAGNHVERHRQNYVLDRHPDGVPEVLIGRHAAVVGGPHPVRLEEEAPVGKAQQERRDDGHDPEGKQTQQPGRQEEIGGSLFPTPWAADGRPRHYSGKSTLACANA